MTPSPTPGPPTPGPLLEVRDLGGPWADRRVRGRGRAAPAVDGVSFRISRGESFGLVGESGSGARELARAVARAGTATSGEVLLDGEDVGSARPDAARRRIRALRATPRLDGRRTVAAVLDAERRAHGLPAAGDAGLLAVTDAVELPAGVLARNPAELPDGQRRRVDVARALCTDPDLVVADEPTSGLDITVAAQLLDLLGRLRGERGIGFLVVARDPGIAAHLSDRVGVMYLGAIVEEAPADALLRTPQHPYTRALLSAVPVPDPEVEDRRERIVLAGDAPTSIPTGCAFHPRCPWRRPARCVDERPGLRTLAGAGQRVACHHAEDIRAGDAAARPIRTS